VFERGRGVVLFEPTVIAFETRTRAVLAMGSDAWKMIGRTPATVVAVRPLAHGAITDFEVTKRVIRLLLERTGVARFTRPRVVVCVPSGITEVEERAVLDAVRAGGAGAAYLIDAPIAGAIGAGLPVHEPLGTMVVDIGGGTTEAAVVSLGGVVAHEAVRVGSMDVDVAIQSHLRREYSMAIGERTAEELKMAIGSAYPGDDSYKAEVRGRDLTSGSAKTAIVAPDEMRAAIAEPVTAITNAVMRCLAQTPPDLANDLILEGVHLVGGGALQRGLPERIAAESGLPVHVASAPLECVVTGAGRCLESFNALRHLFRE
jgi:rod shape-determining protein MreB